MAEARSGRAPSARSCVRRGRITHRRSRARRISWRATDCWWPAKAERLPADAFEPERVVVEAREDEEACRSWPGSGTRTTTARRAPSRRSRRGSIRSQPSSSSSSRPRNCAVRLRSHNRPQRSAEAEKTLLRLIAAHARGLAFGGAELLRHAAVVNGEALAAALWAAGISSARQLGKLLKAALRRARRRPRARRRWARTAKAWSGLSIPRESAANPRANPQRPRAAR